MAHAVIVSLTAEAFSDRGDQTNAQGTSRPEAVVNFNDVWTIGLFCELAHHALCPDLNPTEYRTQY